ncbi:hypothetical protein B7486_47840 [cyanobacterium TDX16]|nr:hypothetical protein B7486_47840 [cyanobacterium TDX16]
MKFSYRGIPYKNYLSSHGSGHPCAQAREYRATDRGSYRGVTYCVEPRTKPTEVPATLVARRFIYRGVTYFQLIYQDIILYIQDLRKNKKRDWAKTF